MRRQKLILPIFIILGLSLLLFACGKKDAPSVPEQTTAEAAVDDSAADGSQAVVPSAPAGSENGSFVGSFVTRDLDGNEVTESIFAEKEYTMINVWGTYCGPCINEMPELETIHQELPDNMQIIGIVCDLPYEIDIPETQEMADEIVEVTGVTYPSLCVWSYADWFYDTTNVVPTTYFVDSEGNLVGDIIYGADVEAYKAAIKNLGK